MAPIDRGIPPPGYRLPDTTHVGAVRLQVSDLSRSLVFYTGVLGLRVMQRTRQVAVLGPLDDDRALVELHERPGVRAVPRRGLLGLYHFAILLPDRAALGRFVSHLAQANTHAGAANHLVSESMYLWDPDGLGIEVYADRPRSEWAVKDQELVMTTDPLDLRSVIGSGGGEPWIGMPASAVMGHVHLSVGALTEAEAFYHAVLGFDKTVWSYPGALFLAADGYHHHLGTNIWAAGAPAATEDDARLLEWELVLPTNADVDAAAHSVAAAQQRVVADGSDRLLRDPWGTTVRLTYDSRVSELPRRSSNARSTERSTA